MVKTLEVLYDWRSKLLSNEWNPDYKSKVMFDELLEANNLNRPLYIPFYNEEKHGLFLLEDNEKQVVIPFSPSSSFLFLEKDGSLDPEKNLTDGIREALEIFPFATMRDFISGEKKFYIYNFTESSFRNYMKTNNPITTMSINRGVYLCEGQKYENIKSEIYAAFYYFRSKSLRENSTS